MRKILIKVAKLLRIFKSHKEAAKKIINEGLLDVISAEKSLDKISRTLSKTAEKSGMTIEKFGAALKKTHPFSNEPDSTQEKGGTVAPLPKRIIHNTVGNTVVIIGLDETGAPIVESKKVITKLEFEKYRDYYTNRRTYMKEDPVPPKNKVIPKKRIIKKHKDLKPETLEKLYEKSQQVTKQISKNTIYGSTVSGLLVDENGKFPLSTGPEELVLSDPVGTIYHPTKFSVKSAHEGQMKMTDGAYSINSEKKGESISKSCSNTCSLIDKLEKKCSHETMMLECQIKMLEDELESVKTKLSVMNPNTLKIIKEK